MRVGILYNPISGKGQGELRSKALADLLEQAGHQVRLSESRVALSSGNVPALLGEIDALVVAGGDGTLMQMLDLLAETEVPVYMMPTGNESLFAKAFSHSLSPAGILAALENGVVTKHYYAHAGEIPFFHMLSVGLDSLIVRDVCSGRVGPVGNKGYVLPAIRNAILYRPPEVSLWVDGIRSVNREPGTLIIANHHSYAGMIAPVPEADSLEPKLSARFFPNMGLGGFCSWGLCFALGRKVDLQGSALYQGKELKLEVHSEQAYPVQADGEHIGEAPKTIQISTARISVYQSASEK